MDGYVSFATAYGLTSLVPVIFAANGATVRSTSLDASNEKRTEGKTVETAAFPAFYAASYVGFRHSDGTCNISVLTAVPSKGVHSVLLMAQMNCSAARRVTSKVLALDSLKNFADVASNGLASVASFGVDVPFTVGSNSVAQTSRTQKEAGAIGTSLRPILRMASLARGYASTFIITTSLFRQAVDVVLAYISSSSL